MPIALTVMFARVHYDYSKSCWTLLRHISTGRIKNWALYMHFLNDLAISSWNKFHFGATKNAKSPQPPPKKEGGVGGGGGV